MRPLVRRAYHSLLVGIFAAIAFARWPLRWRRLAYQPEAVRRILVLRFGLLGDSVFLTPALGALRQRFPNAQIDVLATPVQVPILGPLPTVDQVITWEAGDLWEPRVALRPTAWRQAGRTIADLRTQRYDLAVSAYGPLASAVALLSGATYRVGYEAEALPGTLTRTLHGGRYDRSWHEIVYNAALALAAAFPERRLAEFPWDGVPGTQVVVEPAARARATELLGRASRVAGVDAGDSRRLAVFQPGATNGEAKRWPTPHWAALAQRLVGDGWQVALVGGPGDAALGRQIAQRAAVPLLNLIGKTSTPDLLAVLERADVVVSGDSGPMHCAVALGRPTVAIFGPTDPQINGPFDLRRAAVVRYELPCMPCYRLGRVANCPLGHTLCQWLVTPADVHWAIDSAAATPERGE